MAFERKFRFACPSIDSLLQKPDIYRHIPDRFKIVNTRSLNILAQVPCTYKPRSELKCMLQVNNPRILNAESRRQLKIRPSLGTVGHCEAFSP